MHPKEIPKKLSITIEQEYDQYPYFKKITQPNYQNRIFQRKDDYRRSLNNFSNIKHQKERQKQKEKEKIKLQTTQFANPFIKMKMQSARNNKNNNKLILACIDLGLQQNPQSAPVSTKKSSKPSFTIKQKLKNLSQSKSKKFNDDKNYSKQLIQKSKWYLDMNISHHLNQTQVLLEKLKLKNYQIKKKQQKEESIIRSKIQKAYKIQSRTKSRNQEMNSLWPFNPYKTIKDRMAKSYELINSYEFKEVRTPILNI